VNAPETGAGILGTLYALGHIAVVVSKWLRDRERKRAMESVPPTEVHRPSQEVDRAILARLDRAEQHDAIVAALFRTQGELVDERRKNEVLRDANNRLALEVHALKADNERKDMQLRAERLATRTLRDQLSQVEAELATAKGELELAHADLRRALLVRE
jgi:hypothetical protein